MTTQSPKCPECGSKFATVQLLAMHRKRMHGVEGTSKAHLAAKALREKKAAAAASPVIDIPQHKCPECAVVFSSAPVLGRHRRIAHGVPGSSHAVLLKQKQDERRLNGEGIKCPDCDFVAVNKGGLGIHRGSAHRINPSLSQADPSQSRGTDIERRAQETHLARRTNGANASRREETHFAADGIPEATLALALGRFQGFCQSMAFEFDLPPRLFAARLAELIYRSQVR